MPSRLQTSTLDTEKMLYTDLVLDFSSISWSTLSSSQGGGEDVPSFSEAGVSVIEELLGFEPGSCGISSTTPRATNTLNASSNLQLPTMTKCHGRIKPAATILANIRYLKPSIHWYSLVNPFCNLTHEAPHHTYKPEKVYLFSSLITQSSSDVKRVRNVCVDSFGRICRNVQHFVKPAQ